jgi:3-phenylpropionate/trans-cinnamate dioxygenase ferredoxin reductase subunit
VQTYAIVGAGVAGASAAEALRAEGFDGRVVLIGEEPESPYQRPPLSKQLLRGEVSAEFPSLHAAEVYASASIELILGDRVAR